MERSWLLFCKLDGYQKLQIFYPSKWVLFPLILSGWSTKIHFIIQHPHCRYLKDMGFSIKSLWNNARVLLIKMLLQQILRLRRWRAYGSCHLNPHGRVKRNKWNPCTVRCQWIRHREGCFQVLAPLYSLYDLIKWSFLFFYHLFTDSISFHSC